MKTRLRSLYVRLIEILYMLFFFLLNFSVFWKNDSEDGGADPRGMGP
jgi:hypothetical protein